MIDFTSTDFVLAFEEEKRKIHEEVSKWPSEFREKTRRVAVLTFPREVEMGSGSSEKPLDKPTV